MPTKLFSRLTDVRGLPAASQSNTMRVNIPPVGRLLNIKGSVTQNGARATLAVMKQAIGDVKFIVGTRTIRQWRFAEYLAMLEANGYQNSDGYFPYFFAEPWRATVLDEELVSLQMGGRFSQVAMECDITQPAQPLEFDFGYEYDMAPKVDNSGKPITGIFGHTLQVENPGGGYPIIGLKDRDFDGPLQRLFVVAPSTADITRVRVMQSDTVIYDRFNTAAKPELARSLQDMGMSIPANFTTKEGTFKVVPVIFDNNQRLANNIMNKSNLKLQLDLSESVQVRILIEHVLDI